MSCPTGYMYNSGTNKCDPRVAIPINGVCGSANGSTVSTAPISNLCSAGKASPVSGNGPWSWSCNSSNGGTNASCFANKTVPTCTPQNGICSTD